MKNKKIATATPYPESVAPSHIAIIMDGNGRWATAQGFPRSKGHKEGVKRVQDIVEASIKLGIKYLTLYTFSTENWLRPTAEIDILFNLLSQNLLSQLNRMKKNGVSLHAIGDLKKLPLLVRKRLQAAIKETEKNDKLHLTIALSYSSKWEFTEVAKRIAKKVEEKKIALNDITDEVVQSHLATAFMPDPDMFIRTGGEFRVSNFLLYQIAYSELFFTPVCWPEFTEAELSKLIEDFKLRKRTYGAVLPTI